MPRDTPPAPSNPKPQVQPRQPIREPTPPPKPKPTEQISEPVMRKEGPSDTIEEAFLRAGATVIEVAPVHRDFQREAVNFVPSAVKRRPPPKKTKKPEETSEEKVNELEKSFTTTVEVADVEDGVPTTEAALAKEVLSEPSAPLVQPPDTRLKRPLQTEPKSAPAPAAPKRRRMVNAAPEV